jgi:hypothetical protein
MDDALLETWIDHVNETGTEYGVTLLVGGWIVTGHITPMLRYRDWLKEVGRRATITKGRHRLPGGGIGPISENQAAKARAEWENAEEESLESSGVRFCVRDAAIATSGASEGWGHLPFLVVKLSSVDAFSPVRLNT